MFASRVKVSLEDDIDVRVFCANQGVNILIIDDLLTVYATDEHLLAISTAIQDNLAQRHTAI